MTKTSKTDFVLRDPEEFSPIQEQRVSSQEGFWETYHRFQHAIAFADKVDLDVVDNATGKKTSFNQVRFSVRNFSQKH